MSYFQRSARKDAVRTAAMRVLHDSPQSLKTIDTTIGTAMFFREGQPHLREGIPILARQFSTLLFAIAQAVLVTIVANDFWFYTQELPERVILLPALGMSPMAAAQFAKGGLLLGMLPAVPVFFLINVGWVLFAEKILYPKRPFWKLYSLRSPRTLLGGVMGLVPLRFISIFLQTTILPAWANISSSDPKAAILGAARLGQFYTAARIAMLNCRAEDAREPEIVFAQAIVSRGEEIWDGLGSYVWVPIITYVIVGAFVLSAKPMGFEPLVDLIVSPSSVLVWIGYLAFTKAGLGALIIDAMRAQREN